MHYRWQEERKSRLCHSHLLSRFSPKKLLLDKDFKLKPYGLKPYNGSTFFLQRMELMTHDQISHMPKRGEVWGGVEWGSESYINTTCVEDMDKSLILQTTKKKKKFTQHVIIVPSKN